MADIRKFPREGLRPVPQTQPQSDYKEKIWKHRKTITYRILFILVVCVVIVVLGYINYKMHVYTRYDILHSISRESGEGTGHARMADAILSYSKDGAYCTEAKGNVVWNQTYEIQDLKIEFCDDVVAIGDYNGRKIYLGNREKLLGEITTTMPIRELTVASTGRVTAVLADTDVTWINTYDPDGENIYSGQTHMYNSGYPGAVSLSPNGELLAVSYIYVDAGVMKTNIAFYNFGPVGANNSDYMVSGHTYSDLLIPMVHFMNNETMFAVGDSRLMFFKGAQVPASEQEYLFQQEIQSVYYSEDYVGLVFMSEQPESRYRMDVYNSDGKQEGSYYFDMEYQDIFFEENSFTVYNEKECLITRMDGTVKFEGEFSKTVSLMAPTAGAYKYILVTDSTIDTIQLK